MTSHVKIVHNGAWTLVALIVIGLVISALHLVLTKLIVPNSREVGVGVSAVVALCVVVYVLGYLVTVVPGKVDAWVERYGGDA